MTDMFSPNFNLYLVYVSDKLADGSRKIESKRIADRDRTSIKESRILGKYFPGGAIDRPYTFVKAQIEEEVEIKLLEQYGNLFVFMANFSKPG